MPSSPSTATTQANRFGGAEVKVEYEFPSFDGTESFDGTMTLYAKPPDAWRMDMGTPDGDIVMISNGIATYTPVSAQSAMIASGVSASSTAQPVLENAR